LLRSGKTRSCGCLRSGQERNIDLAAKRFGKLLVLTKAETKGNIEHRIQLWNVRCDCGKEFKTLGTRLRNGKTKSCGCARQKNDPPFNAIFNTYKKNKRALKFKLTKSQVREITSSNCHYCGVSPQRVSVSQAGDVYVYNGIDRVDNKKGYIEENCVPCCTLCNRAKSNYSVEVFEEWISRLIKYRHGDKT
jgi:hypothetical protein